MVDLYRLSTEENGQRWDRLVFNPPTCTQCKKASAKEKFDFYIKQSYINGSSYLPDLHLDKKKNDNFGFYIDRYKRYYDRYLSSSLKIEEILSEEIKCRYHEGKGNEFKTGKYYSVASSSRFATSCFSENKDGIISLIDHIKINDKQENCKIHLEKDLNVLSKNGGIISYPQMDVVVETDKDIYYIEVKCHEIFDDHKTIELKWKYKESDFLGSLLPCFNETSKIMNKKVEYIGLNGYFLTSNDFNCTLNTYHFDFKQFLCHLMGLLSEKRQDSKRIHFYYLFYQNDEYILHESREIYDELEIELETVFHHFGNLYPHIDFGYFYHNQFDSLDAIIPQFSSATIIY